MAKDTERNVISGTTPIGIAVYPKLTEPDYKWKKEGEYGLKILGNGQLEKKLTVQASAFSESAKEKIEAAGGKAEVV